MRVGLGIDHQGVGQAAGDVGEGADRDDAAFLLREGVQPVAAADFEAGAVIVGVEGGKTDRRLEQVDGIDEACETARPCAARSSSERPAWSAPRGIRASPQASGPSISSQWALRVMRATGPSATPSRRSW